MWRAETRSTQIAQVPTDASFVFRTPEHRICLARKVSSAILSPLQSKRGVDRVARGSPESIFLRQKLCGG